MTLYHIGSLTLDTRPFNADSMTRRAGADVVKKPVMGGLKPTEFMGEGDDNITLSGQLLPFKTGGLDELEIAHSFRRAGMRLPVMRGDGRSLGWFQITSLSEAHKELMRNGIGFIVKYRINLTRTEPDNGSSGIIGALLSVFDLIGR